MADKKSKKDFSFEMIMLKQRMHWSERGISIIFSWAMIALIVAASIMTNLVIDFFEGYGIYMDLDMFVVWILIIPFIVNIFLIRKSQPSYAVTDTRVVKTKPFSRDVAWAIPLNDIIRAEALSQGRQKSDVNILTKVTSGNRLMINKEGEFGLTTLHDVADPSTFVNTLNAARKSLDGSPA